MINKIELPITNYLVIGSLPLNIRYSKDIDVICYKKDINVEFKLLDDYIATFEHNGKTVECLLADEQESLQIFLRDFSNTSYELLYIIKAGHITFPHREWYKHIGDYHLLRKLVDYTNPTIKEYIKLHKQSTQQRLNIKTPKLKGVTKDEFFDDAVVKYYEHDFIHACMAHKEHPMYTYMQHDHNIVECDKKLWDGFTEEEKIQCVLEECYVIALERRIIPAIKEGKIPPNSTESFRWALMRVCTTLCSGWFRTFAINNFYTIFNSYNGNYIKHFYEKEASQMARVSN
jgi:hypothetical protein